MSRGRGPSLSPGPQGDAVPSRERSSGPPSLPGIPMSWSSPPNPTSSTETEHRSGLVPGLIAASVFIMLLLCLYTILWRCMVSQSLRHVKRHQRKRPPSKPMSQKPLCAV